MEDNTQPGTHVDGAFGRGTLSPDGNVLSLDFPQSQPSNLQPGTAPKVTPADIEAQIAGEYYYTAAQGAHMAAVDDNITAVWVHESLALLTHCVLVMRNGFCVTGESACASPENFDADVGRKVARAAAVAKCWPLLGYELRNAITGQRLMAPALWDWPVGLSGFDTQVIRDKERKSKRILKARADHWDGPDHRQEAYVEVEVEFDISEGNAGYESAKARAKTMLIEEAKRRVAEAAEKAEQDTRSDGK